MTVWGKGVSDLFFSVLKTLLYGTPHLIGAIMPSKSEKQRRLMAAAAHDPKFAKKVGVPQSVAKEFNKADKKVPWGAMFKRKSK